MDAPLAHRVPQRPGPEEDTLPIVAVSCPSEEPILLALVAALAVVVLVSVYLVRARLARRHPGRG
jgi:hypothetical protein